MADFVQNGNVIKYVAGANLSRGDAVVFGDRVGIIADDTAKGAEGDLYLTGVWRFTTDVTFTVGAKAYLKAGALVAEATGATLVGYVVAVGAGYVDIRL